MAQLSVNSSTSSSCLVFHWKKGFTFPVSFLPVTETSFSVGCHRCSIPTSSAAKQDLTLNPNAYVKIILIQSWERPKAPLTHIWNKQNSITSNAPEFDCRVRQEVIQVWSFSHSFPVALPLLSLASTWQQHSCLSAGSSGHNADRFPEPHWNFVKSVQKQMDSWSHFHKIQHIHLTFIGSDMAACRKPNFLTGK